MTKCLEVTFQSCDSPVCAMAEFSHSNLSTDLLLRNRYELLVGIFLKPLPGVV